VGLFVGKKICLNYKAEVRGKKMSKYKKLYMYAICLLVHIIEGKFADIAFYLTCINRTIKQ
jgi:hypothetical protein